MCGFAGILMEGATIGDSRHDVTSAIASMTATLHHRGPDAEGYFVRDQIALGHRRLSILDISDAGAQPMELCPGGPVIAYNGEVYNFAELKRELESLGHVFRSRSDTEVLLHVYDAWGLGGLKRLEGIFAFALWDPARHRLVLMRDRLGVKPLFYGDSALGLSFGSEIKAVLAAGGVETAIDQQAFSEYLWYGNTFEDRTFYRGVRALPPGHWLVVEDGQRKLSPWWRVEEWLDRAPTARCSQEAAEQLRQALHAAVKRQLMADVPVGIFLSGGVDSSAIAAAAMQVQNRPLASYSAAFDFDRGINELPKARQVAKHLGLDHHELHIAGADLPEILMALARAHDEPFADAANIPLFLMCQQLGGGIKVVLQGDGGDELFAGYRRHAILRNARWWRLLPHAFAEVARFCGNPGRRFARMAEAVGNSDSALRMGLLLTVETLDDPPDLIMCAEQRAHLASATDPFLAYRNAANRFARFEPVQQMLLTDLTVELPSKFLTKVDRATMAAGVEARVPLLDERVAELVVGMPSQWKVSKTQKKVILRESQRGQLPNQILDGPKTGFSVPFNYWLCSSLKEFTREIILDKSVIDSFGLDKSLIEKTLREISPEGNNKSFLIWKLLQLALWKNSQDI
jgi:asparagine synthase (glutamine-hydrolysing)